MAFITNTDATFKIPCIILLWEETVQQKINMDKRDNISGVSSLFVVNFPLHQHYLTVS